ncbi:UDP-glucose--hexose-1-phosphate uridylyltransferase [Namhaeicola litoreus]|uniref:Galactose-1-phosphate uridylyltransferase n=1 Tax=Namhaeicola litoreus TaxID=1052145 RepID=A0ABW3Y666_9FLAO
MEIYQNPHRRLNILTGEWVLVSPHRTKRPWQGKTENQTNIQRPIHDPTCYLCPGNTRANGKTNPNYSGPYAFVNDFSALLEEIPESEINDGFFVAKSEKGRCKVICFSPDHSLTLPLMEVNDIKAVIDLWQREYRDLGSLDFINHVMIFENKGDTMGCSNPHPHGQIWAQESIPQEVLKKSKQQSEFWLKKNQSLLKVYLEKELKLNERIITENKDFAALVPFWAVWPYEVMILPKKHYQHIGQLNDQEKISFAEIIKKVTIKFDNLFETSFPYSAGIHQSPTDGQDHEEWHFHMSFYPPLLRSATVKKFMVGYEMFANPQRDITAESAAEILKNLPETHFLNL